MKTYAIVLAGGIGKRLSTDIPKQFLKLKDKMIIEYALEKFENSIHIDKVFISAVKGYEDIFLELKNKYPKVTDIVFGGKERQESVFNVLKSINDEPDIVIVHDSARPFITLKEIQDTINVAYNKGNVTTALPCKDTIKVCNDNIVKSTLDRSTLYAIKTPQAFRFNELLEAHNMAIEDRYIGTDDCSLIERMGKEVYIVLADDNNIKITSKIDLIVANAIIETLKNK